MIKRDGNRTTSGSELRGLPSGSLKWCGNEVDRVVASGDGYIRYANGLQICWGEDYIPSGSLTKTYTLPQTFYSLSSYTISTTYKDGLNNDVGIGVGATKMSSSTFAAASGYPTTTAVNWDRHFYYLAIGFWK